MKTTIILSLNGRKALERIKAETGLSYSAIVDRKVQDFPIVLPRKNKGVQP